MSPLMRSLPASLVLSACLLLSPRPAFAGDLDVDGVPDDTDNCTLVANADQRDTDGDGFGNRCDPDFDQNSVVNFADLARLKQKFFQSDPLTDLNGDGVVNFADLAILKASFFRAPGPKCASCPIDPCEQGGGGACWLAEVNAYRALARLPAVSENPTWSDGDWQHSRYMVKNDFIGHTEDPTNPWYSPEGLAAAQNGNVLVSSSASASDAYAIGSWLQGPFHAVGVLDPALQQVGYGSYREADGGWQMGATLDVIRGLGAIPPTVSFPIMYPGDGQTTGLRSYTGGESPDPLSTCPGYAAPSGLPILLQIGPGNLTPNVTGHSLMQGGTSLEHCVFDETNYTNPDGSTQSTGRNVLNARDAIVLIPRNPLTPGLTYNMSITANGQTYAWSFTVSATGFALEDMLGQSLMR